MGNLGYTRYKEGFFIALFVIGLVVAVVAAVFIPKEGMVGLVVNMVKYLAIVVAIIGIIMAVAHNLSVKNPVTVNAYMKAGYFLSGIVALVGVYCVYNFVCDITGEVVTTTIASNTYETESKTIRGIGGFYYIEFNTEEGRVKFPISESTYKEIGESYALKIEYYPNSMVINKIESSTGSEIVDDLIEEYDEKGWPGIINSLFDGGDDYENDSSNSSNSGNEQSDGSNVNRK